MAPITGSRWIRLCGAAAVAAIVVASLIPAKWRLRTGLPWQAEHFLAYFAVTSIFCLALPRPLVVAGSLMAFAALLELLQGLTPDRVPDLPTALSGAGGALAAAIIAKLVIRFRKRRISAQQPGPEPEPRALAQPDEI